jgi:ADP-heptose:LPS heptosyltransferase
MNKLITSIKQRILATIYSIVGCTDWLTRGCRYDGKMQTADLLLIRMDAIGDFVLWQDSLRAYKQKYAAQKVALICTPAVATLAKMDAFFSEILAIDRNRFVFSFQYRRSVVRKIKSYRFNEVISPVYTRDYHADRLVKLAIAPQKIGYDGNTSFHMTSKQKHRRNKWFTRLILCNNPAASEVLINANFVQQVCDPHFTPQLPRLPQLSTNSQDNSPTDMQIDGKYVVYAISASRERKAWAVENFCALARHIPDEYKIVLTGYGALDAAKGDFFMHYADLANKTDRAINLIGKTDLPAMVRIIANATLVVGNDSAAVHIAAAVRTRSITIAGGANYLRFVQYPAQIGEQEFHPQVVSANMPCFNCGYRCRYPLRQRYECLRRISIEDVASTIKRCLL